MSNIAQRATEPNHKEMDASTPWKALATFMREADAKLHQLSEKAAAKVDESNLALHIGLIELEDTWKKAQNKLEKQVETLRQLELRAHAASDEAKVQAHLAKADILTAAHETRERMRTVERRLHNFKVKSESDASRVLKRLSQAALALSQRLEDGPDAVKTTRTVTSL